ncbi:MAG: hypothetical protein PHE17_09120 [Thiothrix sp.]|uniref:hypothetical protein n=1 Tax=Thiothrix sp. TaxID=1032 RepID=UPI00261CBA37|nr:hypothetical protein [Thiothrix sp.]MDD5393165.1 hypothetical protein [Thiothrix sp.]
MSSYISSQSRLFENNQFANSYLLPTLILAGSTISPAVDIDQGYSSDFYRHELVELLVDLQQSKSYATYTAGSDLLSEKDYAGILSSRNKYTEDAKSFLLNQSNIAPKDVSDLLSSIFSIYNKASTKISIYRDLEEGWVKPVIIIDSGINDFDMIYDLEDKLFEIMSGNDRLLKIASFFIISQI